MPIYTTTQVLSRDAQLERLKTRGAADRRVKDGVTSALSALRSKIETQDDVLKISHELSNLSKAITAITTLDASVPTVASVRSLNQDITTFVTHLKTNSKPTAAQKKSIFEKFQAIFASAAELNRSYKPAPMRVESRPVISDETYAELDTFDVSFNLAAANPSRSSSSSSSSQQRPTPTAGQSPLSLALKALIKDIRVLEDLFEDVSKIPGNLHLIEDAVIKIASFFDGIKKKGIPYASLQKKLRLDHAILYLLGCMDVIVNKKFNELSDADAVKLDRTSVLNVDEECVYNDLIGLREALVNTNAIDISYATSLIHAEDTASQECARFYFRYLARQDAALNKDVKQKALHLVRALTFTKDREDIADILSSVEDDVKVAFGTQLLRLKEELTAFANASGSLPIQEHVAWLNVQIKAEVDKLVQALPQANTETATSTSLVTTSSSTDVPVSSNSPSDSQTSSSADSTSSQDSDNESDMFAPARSEAEVLAAIAVVEHERDKLKEAFWLVTELIIAPDFDPNGEARKYINGFAEKARLEGHPDYAERVERFLEVRAQEIDAIRQFEAAKAEEAAQLSTSFSSSSDTSTPYSSSSHSSSDIPAPPPPPPVSHLPTITPSAGQQSSNRLSLADLSKGITNARLMSREARDALLGQTHTEDPAGAPATQLGKQSEILARSQQLQTRSSINTLSSELINDIASDASGTRDVSPYVRTFLHTVPTLLQPSKDIADKLKEIEENIKQTKPRTEERATLVSERTAFQEQQKALPPQLVQTFKTQVTQLRAACQFMTATVINDDVLDTIHQSGKNTYVLVDSTLYYVTALDKNCSKPLTTVADTYINPRKTAEDRDKAAYEKERNAMKERMQDNRDGLARALASSQNPLFEQTEGQQRARFAEEGLTYLVKLLTESHNAESRPLSESDLEQITRIVGHQHTPPSEQSLTADDRLALSLFDKYVTTTDQKAIVRIEKLYNLLSTQEQTDLILRLAEHLRQQGTNPLLAKVSEGEHQGKNIVRLAVDTQNLVALQFLLLQAGIADALKVYNTSGEFVKTVLHVAAAHAGPAYDLLYAEALNIGLDTNRKDEDAESAYAGKRAAQIRQELGYAALRTTSTSTLPVEQSADKPTFGGSLRRTPSSIDNGSSSSSSSVSSTPGGIEWPKLKSRGELPISSSTESLTSETPALSSSNSNDNGVSSSSQPQVPTLPTRPTPPAKPASLGQQSGRPTLPPKPTSLGQQSSIATSPSSPALSDLGTDTASKTPSSTSSASLFGARRAGSGSTLKRGSSMRVESSLPRALIDALRDADLETVTAGFDAEQKTRVNLDETGTKRGPLKIVLDGINTGDATLANAIPVITYLLEQGADPERDGEKVLTHRQVTSNPALSELITNAITAKKAAAAANDLVVGSDTPSSHASVDTSLSTGTTAVSPTSIFPPVTDVAPATSATIPSAAPVDPVMIQGQGF